MPTLAEVPKASPALVLVFSSLLLAACGGGGGGGGGGGAASDPAVSGQTPTASSAASAVVVSDSEVSRSRYITQSGAKTAWDQGYGGKGVVVATLDSGITSGLEDFSGRIHGASGNFKEDAQGNVIKVQPVSDEDGHGTWVASVLAAGANGKGIVGVAPQATLLALGFYGPADMTGTSSFLLVNMERLSVALAQSREAGASVVNGSFGLESDSPSFRSALQQSVAAGQVLVFAAGNGGQANPSLPARYAKESWANGQIIAVGAVDANRVISSYSNRAGDAMQFYLVAPGDVTATDRDGSLISVAGTSFSTPQVAGAAALLKQKWPQLKASQIAGVLFSSATDLGEPGVDPIYGRGLLNIDKAMQPIGQLAIATPAGGSVPVNATGLALPAGGVASAVNRAVTRGALTVAATDDFGRDFSTNLANKVSRAGSPLAGDVRQELAKEFFGIERNTGPWRFNVLPAYQASTDRPILTARSFFGYREGNGWQLAGGSTDRLDQFFGLHGKWNGLSHPYLSLARDGQFAGTGFSLSDRARFRAGALNSATASGQVLDFSYSNQSPFQARPMAGDWAVAVTSGSVTEKNRYLGMSGSGAFALAAGRSGFTTLGGQYWLDHATELGGNVSVGRTEGGGTGNLHFSPLTIWSAEAGITRYGAWLAGDRLGFSVGKPLMVSGGSLYLNLPARISDDGLLGFRESRLSLAGSGSETRLGFSYAMPASRLGKLSLKGMYRFDADNEVKRKDSLLGVQYQWAF